nr:hypothetical protein [uncultured Microbacterium sp.]
MPTAWLKAVADWIAQRREVMAIIATLVLLVAVLFAAARASEATATSAARKINQPMST